jgi:hypothetical protein
VNHHEFTPSPKPIESLLTREPSRSFDVPALKSISRSPSSTIGVKT